MTGLLTKVSRCVQIPTVGLGNSRGRRGVRLAHDRFVSRLDRRGRRASHRGEFGGSPGAKCITMNRLACFPGVLHFTSVIGPDHPWDGVPQAVSPNINTAPANVIRRTMTPPRRHWRSRRSPSWHRTHRLPGEVDVPGEVRDR